MPGSRALEDALLTMTAREFAVLATQLSGRRTSFLVPDAAIIPRNEEQTGP